MASPNSVVANKGTAAMERNGLQSIANARQQRLRLECPGSEYKGMAATDNMGTAETWIGRRKAALAATDWNVPQTSGEARIGSNGVAPTGDLVDNAGIGRKKGKA